MKKNISELELWEVDYFVAKAEEIENFHLNEDKNAVVLITNDWPSIYSPTTNPSQAWPIIERERISIEPIDNDTNDKWLSIKGELVGFSYGKTSLESAMRCFLAFIYGEEVEI